MSKTARKQTAKKTAKKRGRPRKTAQPAIPPVVVTGPLAYLCAGPISITVDEGADEYRIELVVPKVVKP